MIPYYSCNNSFLSEIFSYDNCHRNFGPGNFGPGDQNFQWKIGPAGPIFSGKMVRLWKIGPNNGPSISALVTSDCCG